MFQTRTPVPYRDMIHALANFFRGIHMFMGATAPAANAPYEQQKKFVLMWAVFCVLIALWIVGLLFFLGVL